MDRINTTLVLRHYYKSLAEYLRKLDEQSFLFAPNGKWSASEQLDHLLKSIAPVNQALSLPNFVIKLMFGKANRPSKSYEELVEKYQGKLLAGGKAPKTFVPNKISFAERETKLKRIEKLALSITRKANNYKEEDLDALVLPHPLLGKLTLREMLYFTAYHCKHHQNLMEKAIADNEKNNS